MKNNAAFQIDYQHKLVTVCCSCYPGDTLWGLPEFASFPAAGYRISHGICAGHAAAFKRAAKLAAVKRSLEPYRVG